VGGMAWRSPWPRRLKSPAEPRSLAMSPVLVEQVLRREGFQAEEVPGTIKALIGAALRAGVEPSEIRVVRPTTRDPLLVIRGRVVASWIDLR